MTAVSDKTEVPPHGDVKAWETLRWYREERPAAAQAGLASRRVERIHELERRIEELRSRPDNKDRRRLVEETEQRIVRIRALLEEHRA